MSYYDAMTYSNKLRASEDLRESMVLIVDDLLELPVKLTEIVLNAITQTAFKTAWADYRRRLGISLIRLKRDFNEGKVTKSGMKELESKIYYEMRLARQVLGSEE